MVSCEKAKSLGGKNKFHQSSKNSQGSGQLLSYEEAKHFLKAHHSSEERVWEIDKKYYLEQDPDQSELKKAVELVTKTTELIGPKASDPTKRYAERNLNCHQCHSKGKSGLPGTAPYSLPWFNIADHYPKLDIKTMQVITLEERILGMIGTGEVQATRETPEIKLIAKYIRWLNNEQFDSQKNIKEWLTFSKEEPQFRAGEIELKKLSFEQGTDPCRGRPLYEQSCSSCHGTDGRGQKSPSFEQGGGYTFPPLSGPDSYGEGGNVYLIPVLASLTYTSMPPGATWEHPSLTVSEAKDIAAYVNSAFDRDRSPGRAKLYPNEKFRPDSFVLPEDFGLDPSKLYEGKPTREYRLRCDPNLIPTELEKKYLDKKFGPYEKPY